MKKKKIFLLFSLFSIFLFNISLRADTIPVNESFDFYLERLIKSSNYPFPAHVPKELISTPHSLIGNNIYHCSIYSNNTPQVFSDTMAVIYDARCNELYLTYLNHFEVRPLTFDLIWGGMASALVVTDNCNQIKEIGLPFDWKSLRRIEKRFKHNPYNPKVGMYKVEDYCLLQMKYYSNSAINAISFVKLSTPKTFESYIVSFYDDKSASVSCKLVNIDSDLNYYEQQIAQIDHEYLTDFTIDKQLNRITTHRYRIRYARPLHRFDDKPNPYRIEGKAIEQTVYQVMDDGRILKIE